jgi:hypothetical protein
LHIPDVALMFIYYCEIILNYVCKYFLLEHDAFEYAFICKFGFSFGLNDIVLIYSYIQVKDKARTDHYIFL